MALSSSNENWGDTFLYKFSSISRSPRIFKGGAALNMPPIPLNSAAVINELKADLKSLKYTIAPGLAEHIIADKYPFEISEKFMEGMEGTFEKRPQYLVNKLTDRVTRIVDSINGAPITSQEEELSDWFNLLIVNMARLTGTYETGDLRSPRKWSSRTSTTPIHEGPTVQKPDIILFENGETMVDSWASVRIICELSTQPGFTARQRENLLKRFREMYQHQPGRRFILG